MKTQSRIAVIGAGPAGIAAVIQLRRFGFDPLLFERSRVGGLLNNAYSVENYPGFPNGISGINLVGKFKEHLKKWKITVTKDHVTKVTRNSDRFILEAGKKYCVDILIIASGTKPKLPNLAIDELGDKIFFEVYPIRNKKNKRIVIVGAGDAAFDYALNLGRHNSITIINRSKEIKGLDLLLKRVKTFSTDGVNRVSYLNNTRILAIKQLNNCLIAQLSKDGKGSHMQFDYIMFAIGREPALNFLSPSIARKFPAGDSKRLYFIGDVRQGNFRQTAIAVGDGIQAAMKIHQHLQTQKPQG